MTTSCLLGKCAIKTCITLVGSGECLEREAIRRLVITEMYPALLAQLLPLY